jgi:hypothetical protein
MLGSDRKTERRLLGKKMWNILLRKSCLIMRQDMLGFTNSHRNKHEKNSWPHFVGKAKSIHNTHIQVEAITFST